MIFSLIPTKQNYKQCTWHEFFISGLWKKCFGVNLWQKSYIYIYVHISFTVHFLSFLTSCLWQQAMEWRTETDMKEAIPIITWEQWGREQLRKGENLNYRFCFGQQVQGSVSEDAFRPKKDMPSGISTELDISGWTSSSPSGCSMVFEKPYETWFNLPTHTPPIKYLNHYW